jgi:copper transport protein
MRRAAAVCLLVLTCLALTAGTAGAHALVRSSDPPDGAILDAAPKQVSITFTEPPDPPLSFIHVLDQSGSEVEAGKAAPVPGHATQLRVALGPIGQGVYTVTWRVVSKADGHVTAGSFSFGVGVSPPAGKAGGTSAGQASSPSPLDAAGRWMLYWGLAVLLSASVLGVLAFGGRLPGPGWLLMAAWALAAIGLVLMTVAERSAVGIPLADLLRSRTGQELVKQGIAVVVAASAVALAIGRRTKATLVALGVVAAGAMFVHAQAGHASTASSIVSRWFNTSVQELHLMAVGVWVGGLVWLLIGTRGRADEERTDIVRRFSWLAGIAVAVVAVTGVIRAIDELGGITEWGRLLSTSFGVTILVKTAIFGALLLLGARNRYVNVPSLGGAGDRFSSLRRTVTAEVLLAAGVLGAAGVLTQLPPASYASAQKTPAVRQVVAQGHDFATTVRVRLVATPGAIGPNSFRATVLDFDTGRPVPASAVTLRFALPSHPGIESAIPLKKGPGGVWSGPGTALSMPGRWQVTVLVEEPASSVEVPLQLQPRLPPEDIQVSRAAGQPTLYTIALPGGGQLQTYVDPGTAGPNAVHFTFFDAGGKELPIESATAQEIGPLSQGAMKLIRFSAGHFVANRVLTMGTYQFIISATARDGRTVTGYFSQKIGG